MEVDVIWLGSILTALCGLGGMAWKVHVFFNKFEDRFEQYDKTMRDNTIQILRMTLLCEDLPITDRISAGKIYIELGGNGYGHIVYDQLVESLKQDPHTVTHSGHK